MPIYSIIIILSSVLVLIGLILYSHFYNIHFFVRLDRRLINVEHDVSKLKTRTDFSELFMKIHNEYAKITGKLKRFNDPVDDNFKAYIRIKHDAIFSRIHYFTIIGLENITTTVLKQILDQQRSGIKNNEAQNLLSKEFIDATTDMNISFIYDFYTSYSNDILIPDVKNGVRSEIFTKISSKYYRNAMNYTLDEYIKCRRSKIAKGLKERDNSVNIEKYYDMKIGEQKNVNSNVINADIVAGDKFLYEFIKNNPNINLDDADSELLKAVGSCNVSEPEKDEIKKAVEENVKNAEPVAIVKNKNKIREFISNYGVTILNVIGRAAIGIVLAKYGLSFAEIGVE